MLVAGYAESDCPKALADPSRGHLAHHGRFRPKREGSPRRLAVRRSLPALRILVCDGRVWTFENVGGLHVLGSETDRDEARAHPARDRRAFEQP